MSVTREQLDHLCKLAALNLSDDQKDKFGPQLDLIVWLVSKLEWLELDDTMYSDSQCVGHTNEWIIPSNWHILDNVRHPIVGNMPSVSFTTRWD